MKHRIIVKISDKLIKKNKDAHIALRKLSAGQLLWQESMQENVENERTFKSHK